MSDQAFARRPVVTALYAALLAAIAGSLAWFALPVLSATYNEGFQTTIVMTAYAILHGGLTSVDPLHGLNNDFFVISRFGVSLAVAGLIKLGLPAVVAFRLLMLGSLVLLVAANAGLLAWRYRINPLLACLPALLFPGLFESAWFFNDNVLSAALSSAAVLLFWARTSLLATAGAAALWGLAVACRSDAALIAPAFAILGWFKFPGWGARIRHAAVAGPIAVAIPFLVYGAFGLNLLEIFPLTRRATELWARTDTWAHVLQPAVKGFSAPGLLAIGIGAVAVVLRRRWLEVLLCLAVPLVYAAAYGRMLTEVRYLLPLTPFFGLLMVEGWHAVQAAGQGARRVTGAAFAVLAITCFAPPAVPAWHPVFFMAADHDMPRPLIGRFWSPALGMWWNATLDEGAAALAAALEARVTPGRVTLVVSTYWNPDRMVDLILREHGFTLAQAAAPAACRAAAEMFTRDGATVVHLRPHLPIIPTERTEVDWRLLDIPCIHALGDGDDTPVLVAGWTKVASPPAGPATAEVKVLLPASPRTGFLGGLLVGERSSYFVAATTVGLVPAFLDPAIDASEAASAQAAVLDPRVWSASELDNVR